MLAAWKDKQYSQVVQLVACSHTEKNTGSIPVLTTPLFFIIIRPVPGWTLDRCPAVRRIYDVGNRIPRALMSIWRGGVVKKT